MQEVQQRVLLTKPKKSRSIKQANVSTICTTKWDKTVVKAPNRNQHGLYNRVVTYFFRYRYVALTIIRPSCNTANKHNFLISYSSKLLLSIQLQNMEIWVLESRDPTRREQCSSPMVLATSEVQQLTKKVRPGHWLLCSIQCSDTDGWLTKRASGLYKPCATVLKYTIPEQVAEENWRGTR